jgi:hypothetical protein
MAIIWRNEFRRGDARNPGITLDPPPGIIEITKVEQAADGNWHIWFAPIPARPAGPSDEDRIRDAMAGARDHPGRTITR